MGSAVSTTSTGPTKGPKAVQTVVVFTALAFIIVGIRLVTRFVLVRSVGLDDLLVTFALICSIALTALIADEVKYGMGRHFSTLSPEEFTASLKPFYASILVYNLGLSCIKCSILLQYLRIFVGPTVRRVCWTLLAIISVQAIYAFLSQMFECTPVAYFWDKSLDGHCISAMVIWFINASFNIASDIAILITPMPVLRKLQVPTRQKVGLMLIFAVGAFACVTSILRLHSLYVVSVSTDITWDNVGAAVWSSVEENVGIICACLPMLKPFVKRFAPRLLGSTMSGGQSQTPKTDGTWSHSQSRGIALTSVSERNKGFSTQSGPTAYRNDIYVMNKDEEMSAEHLAEEGQIKVVTAFEIQHHRDERATRNSGSSEVDLILESNTTNAIKR